MKIKLKILVVLLGIISLNCSKQDELEEGDAIVGKWFLVAVNDTNVSNIECYQDSYIQSDGNNIDFFIVNLLDNDTCETVLDESTSLTISDGFYYIDDEALEIYIEGNQLTWRVDFETNLIFEK